MAKIRDGIKVKEVETELKQFAKLKGQRNKAAANWKKRNPEKHQAYLDRTREERLAKMREKAKKYNAEKSTGKPKGRPKLTDEIKIERLGKALSEIECVDRIEIFYKNKTWIAKGG